MLRRAVLPLLALLILPSAPRAQEGPRPGSPDPRWVSIVARVINEGTDTTDASGNKIRVLGHGKHQLVLTGKLEDDNFFPGRLWILLLEPGDRGATLLSRAAIDLGGRPVQALRERVTRDRESERISEPVDAGSPEVLAFLEEERRFWLSEASRGETAGYAWTTIARRAILEGEDATLRDGARAKRLIDGGHQVYVMIAEEDGRPKPAGLLFVLVERPGARALGSSVRIDLDGFPVEASRSVLKTGTAAAPSPLEVLEEETLDPGAKQVAEFVKDETYFWLRRFAR